MVVYYVGHGMLTPKDSRADGGAEETLLLWSDSFPFAALYAVQQHENGDRNDPRDGKASRALLSPVGPWTR